MNQKIIIESPCHENWNAMPKNDIGRHCNSCQTTVVDFSKMSLEDIHLYFKNNYNQNVCGRYHQRHGPNTNKWFKILNQIEFKFSGTKFKKLGLGFIYLMLLLSGCKTKKKNTQEFMGRFLYNKNTPPVEQTSLAKK